MAVNQFRYLQTLQGNDAPTCSHCRSRQSCTKQQSICRPPARYLVVHLKRFASSGKKINRPVSIQPRLTIAGAEFILRSAVCHCGSECSGHNYTLFREADNQWVNLDDGAIRGPLTDDAAHDRLQSYAYLCIYEAVAPVPTASLEPVSKQESKSSKEMTVQDQSLLEPSKDSIKELKCQ